MSMSCSGRWGRGFYLLGVVQAANHNVIIKKGYVMLKYPTVKFYLKSTETDNSQISDRVTRKDSAELSKDRIKVSSLE